MRERRRLADHEIAAGLGQLEGWSVAGGKLRKEFRFRDFEQAFAFMTDVARIAESMDHHPDWSNVYDRVTIELVTHDLGGISGFDLEFASRVEALLP